MLFLGFLKWNPEVSSFWEVPSYWIENFTTVAITEELYFRSVLLNLIHEVFPSKRKWIGVVLSSIAFGLWRIIFFMFLCFYVFYFIFYFLLFYFL